MRGRTFPIVCIAVLVLLAAFRVAAVWDELPERVASHFGPNGQPNAWQTKTAFFAIFSAIGLGTLVTLLLPGWALRYVPAQLINLPHRDYWLTPERRPETMRRLGRFMDWFGFGMTLMLVATLELVVRANIARTSLDNTAMVILLVAFFAFTFVWLVRMWRHFKPPAR